MFKEDFEFIKNHTDKVFDILKIVFKDCILFNMEDSENSLYQMFDLKAGIDYIMNVDGQIFGLANKIRRTDYNDFNIRCSRFNGATTEYEKLVKSKRDNAFRPTYHINTVVENNKVTKVSIIKTDDLLEAIDKGIGKIKYGSNSKFYCINIDKLVRNGYNVFVYKRKEEDIYTIYNNGEIEKSVSRER